MNIFEKIKESTISFLQWLGGEEEIEVKVVLDDGAYCPTRAHSTDAGLDLYCPKGQGQVVKAKGSALFDTGVHMELPEGTVGNVESKSGLNVNHNIVSFGTIDVGYTGSIKVKLYNLGDTDYEVRDGDKISQLVIKLIITPRLDIVDSLDDTERGNNGFGSTGR